MKKFNNKKIILITIAFILFLLSFYPYSCATTENGIIEGGIAKFDSSRIVAWTQLDLVTVFNAQNQSFCSASSQSTLNSVKLQNKIDICFILDVSGSMSGTKLDTMKSASKTLITNLSEKFEDKEKLRVSIILFGGSSSDDVVVLFPFTPCTNLEYINNSINALNAHGGTPTDLAINKSHELWSANIANSAEYKYNILITDGQPNQISNTQIAFQNFKDTFGDSINFLTILVYTPSQELQNMFNTYSQVINTSTSNFEKAIIDDIWSYIFWNYVDTDNITEANNTYKVFYNGNTYLASIENENLYGSTLVLNYSIHIKTVKKINSVSIIDYLPECTTYVSSNINSNLANLETLYNADTNTISFTLNNFSGLQTDDYDEEFVINLQVSRILSSSDDINYLKNTIDIRSIQTEEKNYTLVGSPTTATSDSEIVRSSYFTIIPPTGYRLQDIIIPYIKIYVIVLVFIAIIIITIKGNFKRTKGA